MAREAKFNFQDELSIVGSSKIKQKESYTVSVNGKYGQMRFSPTYIRDYQLDGKYIKLYADPSKKAIAWKTLRQEELGNLKGYRKLKLRSTKAGKYMCVSCVLSVVPLLSAVGVKDKSFVNLPIKKYRSPGILEDELSYVELE